MDLIILNDGLYQLVPVTKQMTDHLLLLLVFLSYCIYRISRDLCQPLSSLAPIFFKHTSLTFVHFTQARVASNICFVKDGFVCNFCVQAFSFFHSSHSLTKGTPPSVGDVMTGR